MANQAKTISLVSYVFASLGVIFLGAAVYFLQNNLLFIRTSERAEGIVTALEGETTKRAVVEYKVADKTYTIYSSLNTNPPALLTGDQVAVLYPPDQPAAGRINEFFDFWFLPIFFSFTGFSFGGVGMGMIVRKRWRGHSIAQLQATGQRLSTKFQKVEENTSLTVNGEHPYRIVTQYKDPSNEIHIFKSENLWFDPSDYIRQKEITVLVDPDNFKKYYMDVSFLPKLSK